MIKGRKPEEIHSIFNIENDFTPDEEDEIQKEDNWVLQYICRMMATEGKRMIALQSSNGEVFKVEAVVAMEFQAIKRMIEGNDADSCIPLPNITMSILSKVIEYCTKHVEAVADANSSSLSTKAKAVDEELETWDADFVNVDQSVLFDLILAVNYLDIQGLLDLTCKTVANMLTGKTPAEIRITFNIQSDFTSEEEEQIAGRTMGLLRICRSKCSRCGVWLLCLFRLC